MGVIKMLNTKTIYVKTKYFIMEDETKHFDNLDKAYEFAKKQSKNDKVNFCMVYVNELLNRVYDFGTIATINQVK